MLQKHSHHLVLGFSPSNNCKTKSSPTSAYFSPTPMGSFWQIICEIFHYVHRLIKLWPLRLHDSLCFLVTGLSMFPLWCHLRTFEKAHMQTHHTSKGMVVCWMMNYSALRESESCNKWSRFRANPSSHLFKWNRSPPQRWHGGGGGRQTNRSKRPVA